MGFLYRTVLLLILSVFVMELAAQDQSGMQVSVTDYLLPQYRKKKENLQFVIYGDTARPECCLRQYSPRRRSWSDLR